MGVQRAVEIALDAVNTHKGKIHTYGPLIHNPQVLKLLGEKGMSVLNEIPQNGDGIVLIRAHGVPPDTIKKLEHAGFEVIDATCPRVIKVQSIIKKHARKGYGCIIVGDEDHPEVKGLLGFAGDMGHVVGRFKDLDNLPDFKKAIVVAQTTQNTRFFEAIGKWAEKSGYKIFNTICDSTEKRQAEAKRLAEMVDGVIVVGGHESGNTQRLADVVRQIGKPAFHIETEAELDVEKILSLNHVGITAGASTPNWIIKRIFMAVESLPSTKGKVFWQKRMIHIQRFLLHTNIYIAIGAGCLCYACSALQEIYKPLPYVIISMLYILSMHTLNNLTGRKEARYNDPDRAVFYSSHKMLMSLIAFASGAIGLSIAASMGVFPFFLLCIMSVLGLSYNLTLIPEKLFPDVKFRRIRDLPGSKTILIALAWGITTALFPVVSDSGTMNLCSLVAFIWSSCVVFVRTAIFDIMDMQGDRIVGKETIPILLGRKKSMTFLRLMLLFVFSVLFLSGISPVAPSLSLCLLLSPLYLFMVITIQSRQYMQPGIRFELLTESHFIMVGFITFLWSFLFSA